MIVKRLTLFSALLVLLTGGAVSHGETLRAADVANRTNFNWMALARGQLSVRAGKNVEFIWQSYPAVSYAEIRRSLWLAALHGITRQSNQDPGTCQLMTNELAIVRKRLDKNFAYNVAVRDMPPAGQLIPRLIEVQSSCTLISPEDKTPFPMTLYGKNGEVMNEQSGLAFTSIQLAINFAHSCSSDAGLIFEPDGRIAKDLFVRRFQDGSATVVNLTDRTRTGLSYEWRYSKCTFDMLPADVVHVLNSDPIRFLTDSDEPFLTCLWKIHLGNERYPRRLVEARHLQTVVDETYVGAVTYKTHVIVPPGQEDLYLTLDTCDAETNVTLDGRSLGTRAWKPFTWQVPLDCHGKNVVLNIRVVKRTINEGLQGAPTWQRR